MRQLFIWVREWTSRLRAIIELRLAHPDLPLTQLAHLCDRPTTKDTVAGQIRRLLTLADTRAAAGAPTTTTTLQ